MVSVTILAMIAVMVSRIFSESSRVVGQGRDESLLDETARLLLEYMEQDVGQALIRTNVAFRVHPIDGNDALYFVSTGMRRQLETIPRDTAPMRWQLEEAATKRDAVYKEWNRVVSVVSPYGSASASPSGIRKLAAHSDYYVPAGQATIDFQPVHLAGGMSTTEKEYTEAIEKPAIANHASITFLDITVNGDFRSNRTNADFGSPPPTNDMPRFVDVAIGLIASRDLEHAMILHRSGDPQRGEKYIDTHERVYTRRIFMRNKGTDQLNY